MESRWSEKWFFTNGKFTIGWNEKSAKDLYEAVSQLKVGDIIYLISVSPAHIRSLKIKGIGIVTKSFIHVCKIMNIKIKWLVLEEFNIKIPEDEGKLTNIRLATLYE